MDGRSCSTSSGARYIIGIAQAFTLSHASEPYFPYTSSFDLPLITDHLTPLVALRITLAASRSSPLVYPLLTTHLFDTLVLRTMRIPCGFDVCVSLRQLHDFGVHMISACIYHLRRSSGFYNFTSIDGMISPYHEYRRCDFHWRLRFRPAIGTLRFRCQSAISDAIFTCIPSPTELSPTLRFDFSLRQFLNV
jgi:hypothetical protein